MLHKIQRVYISGEKEYAACATAIYYEYTYVDKWTFIIELRFCCKSVMNTNTIFIFRDSNERIKFTKYLEQKLGVRSMNDNMVSFKIGMDMKTEQPYLNSADESFQFNYSFPRGTRVNICQPFD